MTSKCTWEVENPIGTAILIGDSNAGHFSEGFIAAANQLNMNAIVRTSSGCAFVDLAVVREGIEQVACRNFVTASMAALAELQPSVVVLASASDLRVNGGDGQQFLSSDGSTTSSKSERLAAWESALETTLEAVVASAGGEVYLVQPVPRVANAGKATDASWISLGRSFTGNRLVTKAESLATRNDIVEVQHRIAQQSGAMSIDFFDSICTGNACELRRDGIPVYRDRSHISVPESERLAEEWHSVLRNSA